MDLLLVLVLVLVLLLEWRSGKDHRSVRVGSREGMLMVVNVDAYTLI
jgi:hypothetical protein